MRDFLNIMESQGYYKESAWNKTDFIYTFETGSRIEFFSLDMPHKVRGPRRDRLFINEANNIPKETYDQLEVRTKEEIWLDWNPTREFWFYTELEGKPNVDFVILTYKDNEGLDKSIVESIESRRDNVAWWTVYGEGQLGEVEGKIYKGWKIVDDVPHEARLDSRGLDFGYSQDPAALCSIYYYNGGYIIDENLCRTGMLNRQLADVINNLPDPQTIVSADSAEPKSIDELREYGVNAVGVSKGQGSVNHGIQWVQSQKISITKRSVNFIKAYRNYMWQTDKDGNILDKPDHYLSDAMDSVRYGLESLRPKLQVEERSEPSILNTLIY